MLPDDEFGPNQTIEELRMRSALAALLLSVLFALPISAATTCYYVIVDTLTITYKDGDGNVIGTDTRYYFGYLCFTDGGDMYEVPGEASDPVGAGPGGGAGGGSGTPAPGTGGCQVDMCTDNCNAEYAASIAGDMVESPVGGRTWYKCGPLCVDLATADRNACIGGCIDDCD